MKPTIVSIKRVKTNRLQAEMVDTIDKPGQINVLSKLNRGDSAFDTGSARHAWFPITIESLIDIGASSTLIEKVETLKQGEKVACVITEPKLDGKRLRIQVNETVIPTAYQKDNLLKTAKQLEITRKVIDNKSLAKHEDTGLYEGEQGYFLTEQGEYIFSNTTITVENQVQHVFVEGYLVPETIAMKIGAELASPVIVDEKVATDAMKF